MFEFVTFAIGSTEQEALVDISLVVNAIWREREHLIRLMF